MHEAMWQVGGWAVQKFYVSSFKLAVRVTCKETGQTQLMCETERSEIYMCNWVAAHHACCYSSSMPFHFMTISFLSVIIIIIIIGGG